MAASGGVAENQQLGAFRLLRRIGNGGMGEVWLAEDTRSPRNVAVNILPPHIASDAAARDRLQRVSRLSHPSVAQIYPVEEHDGRVYVAAELVDGIPLAAALRERKLSDYDVVRLVRDIADALTEAHAWGIVHGGISPHNVMISGRRVKVLDFGVGTIADPRADLAALGALLYHALTGAPFSGGETAPFYSLRPDLPQELATIIARCKQRGFASADELVAALERMLPRLSREALPVTPTVVEVPSAGKRLLIVDDDPAIRRLFEMLAKRQGIECDTAGNGPEGIAALKRSEYALMFLDLMMPRIDGWGVLDYLRTRAARVPMLFIVTAFLDQTVSAADRGIVAGIIYKPVDADEIAALMSECVRGNQPAGTLRKTRHHLIAAAG